MLSKNIIPIFFLTLIPLFAQKEKDVIVAEFGKQKIFLSEFKYAYLDIIKKPKVFDSKKLREDFLDDLIDTRIIANEEKKTNLQKNELLEYKIEAYKDKNLREAHYNVKIKPQINISEDDIEEAYQFSQEERKISHLFFTDKEKADSAYKQLQDGVPFDSLAKVIFKDSSLANKGGDLGWVYWDQLDYDWAQVAFRLPANQLSEPVKSVFGYHIIKVTDFKKTPLITRSEYELHKRKAKYMLEYKIGEKYSFNYLTELLKKSKVVIYPKALEYLDNQLKNKFKRKPTQVDQMNEMQLRDEEVKIIEFNLWDMRKEVLATINGKDYTIGKFIGELNYIPYQVVHGSFKNTFDYAIRDYLLTEEAKTLGLEKDMMVKEKTNLYTEYLLALELRKKWVKEVSVSDNDLKNYYDTHKENYKGASFETMKGAIEKIVLGDKKREIVFDKLAILKSKLKVKKYLKPIHDYYDAIQKGSVR